MTLVENLQAYLARLRDRPGSFIPPSGEELVQLRQHLRARFEELQLHANPPRALLLARVFPLWLERIEHLIWEICWSMDALAVREDERIEALCLAIDLHLPRDEQSPNFARAQTKIWHNHLGRLVKEFGEKRGSLQWTRPLTFIRYASELRLTLSQGHTSKVARMGEVLLQLVGRDAIRWLLALEITQSLGDDDEWRMSRHNADKLAKAERFMPHDEHIPWSEPLIERCIELQLLRAEYEDEDADENRDLLADYYCVTPLGRELLAEAGSEETPFTLMAQALLTDQVQAILVPPGKAAAAEATVRHTRMVAHEIRNALVPVRVALQQVWRDLSKHGQDELTTEPRKIIDANIDRIFHFVEDSVRLTRLPIATRAPFDLVPAIRDAIASLDNPPRRPIEPEVDTAARELTVRGHRERLVMAVINLLRNAVQVGGVNVTILIHVSVLPGQRRVQIAVDDDGPGIDPARRTEVFQNGISHRTDGTGHGLALVREVIEHEMSGTVTCQESPRGGARFVIQLPLSQESV